ncbi:MAG: MCP four helix bundle domain-containing protein [Nitrospirae bacterium]|uniref:ATP-binding protein n=1 Tax=Candidatus Magnetobacterium casense TaxID=1455061 RepID=UPI00058FD70D|nr:ATP-binding protein [Candidatus Magnetobacterium casensis]MBF0337782.1 MCP four helix bundle domain-containing protein [Nitrospirota bacterium]
MKTGYSKIIIRIAAGFFLFLGIIAALVGISVSYLSDMEVSIDKIVRLHNVRLGIAQDMRYFVRHSSVLVRNVLLLDDPAGRRYELKRLSEARGQYMKKRNELMADLHDDKSNALLKSLQEEDAITLALWDNVVELSLSGKRKEATDLLVTEVRSVQWKWLADLDTLVETEKEHVKDADTYAADMYRKAKVIITLWGLLAVILGSAISVAITRSIAAPLEETIKSEVARRREQEQVLIHQAKLARMGQLLVNISHHWRQPLHTVGLIIQDIQEAHEHGELDAAYINNAVAEAMQELKGMSDTINDFMNFYSPKEEKERFDVKVATAEVLTLLQPILNVNLIDFTITCHAHNETVTNMSEVTGCGDLMFDTYRQHFQYVMLNILSNSKDAILHQRQQGLLDKDSNGIICVDFYNMGDTIKVTISDNGGGIRKDIMDKIFEPYFTTREQGKGVGQGLYLSRIITETHLNGRIEARNIKGGAMFEVILRHGRVAV